MSECHKINCPTCGFEVEENFLEQKCPRCQTLIGSKFVCGSCHHCGETISQDTELTLPKQL
jgi:phage FluMu protein Com